MEDRSASMLELKALHVPHGHYDVAILGRGLAGLSMALQLKRTRPDTRVLVTDQPERWEEDGLFSSDGLTLAQALEQLPGIEEMDLEARGAAVAGVAPAANQRAGS